MLLGSFCIGVVYTTLMTMFSITNMTRTAIPSLPLAAIKKDILGTQYSLSLTFVGRDRARNLNQTYRKKDYVPNVLSFPLDNTTGEIFITPHVAATEAKHHNLTIKGYIGFLFIHACLHLKGHDHGATMEKAEQRYCKKYQLR